MTAAWASISRRLLVGRRCARLVVRQFANRPAHAALLSSLGTGTRFRYKAAASFYQKPFRLVSSSLSRSLSATCSQHSMHTNRLAQEQSPYLLQHAHNPVDWYPWGEEAFQKAQAEDKPIFLSVGYSTCHWCHVMEHESFESTEVAQLMNEHFVSVKVDREERPDVDKVYMTYVQAISGGGGWPMSVFLTPTLEPIVGGTYFPPEDAYGRPGFKTVLGKVADAWKNQKSELQSQGTRVLDAIGEAVSSGESERGRELSTAQLRTAMEGAYHQLSERFDSKNGGFSGAPKFPRVSEVNLVMLQSLVLKAGRHETEAGKALQMAELTLHRMAAGGIHDHLGGGFARYSVDELWHVPHFEKMLYDNPQIVQTYLDAFRLTKKLEYAQVARDVLDYLIRDMQHPAGGFYSAEDADSLETASGQKKEGAFYVWEAEEIDEVLDGPGGEQSQLLMKYYAVRPEGNANMSRRSDPHGEFGGKNVLIRLEGASADAPGKDEELAQARQKLYERRNKRPRPHLDDKIVTAWNGLAISAFAAASQTLKSEEPPVKASFPIVGCDPGAYLEVAEKAAHFVEANLWDKGSKRLRRSYRQAPSEVLGFDNDYAFLTAGLLDLYAASGDTHWLAWANELQQAMDELFWDPESGGYFSTTGGDASIKLRMKEEQDGAEPAASSIALSNLLRLAAASPPEKGAELQARAQSLVAGFSGHLRQVIIAGKKGSADTQAMLAAAHGVFCPDKVVIAIDPSSEEDKAFWQGFNPNAWEMAAGAKDFRATAFVCQNFACRAPTTNPQQVRALLADAAQSGANPAPAGIKAGKIDLQQLQQAKQPK